MSAQPAPGYFGISDVLAQLRSDFPDISVSKIRFLETEGLIAPVRSPAGYRRFCNQDVDRLRFILAAQRDQYLPLRVIRERLDRIDQQAGRLGREAASEPHGRAGQGGPTGQAGPARHGGASGRAGDAEPRSAQPAARRHGADSYGTDISLGADTWAGDGWNGRPQAGQPGPAGREDGPGADGPDLLTRRELVAAAGLTEALLTELETFGLLRKVGRHYGRDALDVARAAVALTSFGVEARHLRAVRAAAERETTMIESLVAPILRQRGSGARELAGRTARDCAVLVLRLHGALVDGALAEAGLAEPALSGTSLPRQPAAHGSGREHARGVEGASA
jgi:DNA-binding transcriptional MerR regulator